MSASLRTHLRGVAFRIDRLHVSPVVQQQANNLFVAPPGREVQGCRVAASPRAHVGARQDESPRHVSVSIERGVVQCGSPKTIENKGQKIKKKYELAKTKQEMEWKSCRARVEMHQTHEVTDSSRYSFIIASEASV